jgi:hypothetical protein
MSFVELTAELAPLFRFDAFNPNEPRDPSGKWTAGAGGAGKADLGEYTASFSGTKGQYDKRFFKIEKNELKDDDGTIVGTKERTVPIRPIADQVPAEPEEGMIYRGMSGDEFDAMMESGEIKTKGDYNMDVQKGLTYYSTHPKTAGSYASSFAPSKHKPTFDRPAYVVAVKRPANDKIANVEGTGEDEVGVNSAIPKSDITAIYRGTVIATGLVGPELHWERVDKPEPSGPAEEVRGPEQAWDKEKLNKFHARVTYTAIKLGYDAAKVFTSTDTYRFKLNGKDYKAAGAAYTTGGAMYKDPSNGHKYQKGDVVLYAGGFLHPDSSSIPEVVAHEIQHQKFQFALDTRADEKAEIEKEMDRVEAAGKDPWRSGPLNAQGFVRESYSGRWPTYEALEPLLFSTDKLAKHDGVSDYSRNWWKAYHEGTGTAQQAIHETMAEMAANETMTKGEKRFIDFNEKTGEIEAKTATGGDKLWRDLYAAVNDTWTRFHKAKT